jgi:hypothetical protein
MPKLQDWSPLDAASSIARQAAASRTFIMLAIKSPPTASSDGLLLCLIVSDGLFETPQLGSQEEPAFGSRDEALTVPIVAVGLCLLLPRFVEHLAVTHHLGEDWSVHWQIRLVEK